MAKKGPFYAELPYTGSMISIIPGYGEFVNYAPVKGFTRDVTLYYLLLDAPKYVTRKLLIYKIVLEVK